MRGKQPCNIVRIRDSKLIGTILKRNCIRFDERDEILFVPYGQIIDMDAIATILTIEPGPPGCILI